MKRCKILACPNGQKMGPLPVQPCQQGFLYPGDAFQSRAVTVRCKDGHRLQGREVGQAVRLLDSSGGSNGLNSVATGNQSALSIRQWRGTLTGRDSIWYTGSCISGQFPDGLQFIHLKLDYFLK